LRRKRGRSSLSEERRRVWYRSRRREAPREDFLLLIALIVSLQYSSNFGYLEPHLLLVQLQRLPFCLRTSHDEVHNLVESQRERGKGWIDEYDLARESGVALKMA
jgi:hypothetical protein